MADIVTRISQWPANKKIAAAVLLALAVAGSVLVFSWAQMPDYQVLYANLPESDSGVIIQKLQEMNVPYKVNGGGIMVSEDRVYDLRLQLAAEGLPQGGAVGFELFDKTDFGTTDFVQKLNYRRAMQGELARTIASLQEVERARVHLAIPERSLFRPEESRPRASVLVKLRGGRTLSRSQVQGIVHMVASSVDGMASSDVTVVDTTGELLTRPEASEVGLSSSQLEYQRNFEKGLEERILAILQPVAGRDKVRAKVAAALDFTRMESTEETYDPDGQVVRSEQRNVEKTSSLRQGGVPGVASNLPGRNAPQSAGPSTESKTQNEVINYEISRVTRRVVNPTGGVKRVSAAVLVDGAYAEGGEYVPRTEEEIRKYEELVKRAIGFAPERGDEVSVTNMPFESMPMPEFEEEAVDYAAMAVRAVKYAAPVLAVVLFFLMVLRPLVRVLSVPAQSLPGGEPVAVGVQGRKRQIAGGAEELPRLETPKPEGIKGQVLEWAENNPREAADLVRNWIKEKE